MPGHFLAVWENTQSVLVSKTVYYTCKYGNVYIPIHIYMYVEREYKMWSNGATLVTVICKIV